MGGPPKANQARDVVRQRLSPDGARLLQLNDLQRTLRARSPALNHPNICTIYDVGPNYLVMELTEDATLASALTGPGTCYRQSIETCRRRESPAPRIIGRTSCRSTLMASWWQGLRSAVCPVAIVGRNLRSPYSFGIVRV
jgi:hypothetical protein